MTSVKFVDDCLVAYGKSIWKVELRVQIFIICYHYMLSYNASVHSIYPKHFNVNYNRILFTRYLNEFHSWNKTYKLCQFNLRKKVFFRYFLCIENILKTIKIHFDHHRMAVFTFFHVWHANFSELQHFSIHTKPHLKQTDDDKLQCK